jgi:hypothetical protein
MSKSFRVKNWSLVGVSHISPCQKSITCNRLVVMMGGVSRRGESREIGKPPTTAWLKKEEACILTCVPWTLKEGMWKAMLFFRLPAVFQWIHWVRLLNLIQNFQCRVTSISNNGRIPYSTFTAILCDDVIVYNPLVGQVHVYTQECSMINSEHYLYIAYSKLHVIVVLQWRQIVFLTRQVKNVCPFSCGAMANFWFLLSMHV